MAPETIIATGIVISAGAAALAIRKVRARRTRKAQGNATQWRPLPRPEDLRERLAGLGLMQVGHSRRIIHAVAVGSSTDVLEYTYETGFEAYRRRHRSIVAVHRIVHDKSPAVFTRRDWLAAIAEGPAHQRSLVRGAAPDKADPAVASTSDGVSAGPTSRNLVGIMEDAADWSPVLEAGLAEWLAGQPPEISWEVLPGLVAAHAPWPFTDTRVTRVAEAAAGLADWMLGRESACARAAD